MRTRRRIAALIALLGVAWAAFWPAVSAAHARMAHEAMPLCHMAGMMVDPADAPPREGPAALADEGGRTHCPLCIMAFFVAFHAMPEPPPYTFSTGFVTLDTHCAPLPFGTEVRLPGSRGPPTLAA
ncbi:MAG TPA: hypothetical protein VLS49_04785 [Usitatibacter sp.]|nr:hypothetical protein [Usitatibacter sp.]